MAETAAQRKTRLAAELKRLEDEGSESAGKLRESLENLDRREAARKGGTSPEVEVRENTTTIKVQEHKLQTPAQSVKSCWPHREVKGA
jgi:hypothetical protein